MNDPARLDERCVSWKVLLPVKPESRICAIGLDRGGLLGLTRSYETVDTELVEGLQYDTVIVGDRTSHDLCNLISRLKPNGVLVTASQKRIGRWLNDTGFKYSRHYAGLPVAAPRLFVPLASRRLRGKGLAFHSPGSFTAHAGLAAAKGLSILGFRRHLMKRTVNIHARSESVLNSRGLIRWLSDRLGHPIIDLAIYAGSESPRRKITALAIAEGNNNDVVVKIADTESGADAIKQESQALQAIAASSLSGQAPKLISEGRMCGYYIQLQEHIIGSKHKQVARVTGSHLEFLSKLSTIGRKVMPLKETRTWGSVKALADAASSKALPQPVRVALEKVLSDEFANMPVVCHRTHGDFAPWNIKVNSGKLRVYDWEDSLADGLALTDLFHFLYHQALLVGPWPGAKLVLDQMTDRARILARLCEISDTSVSSALRVWLVSEYVDSPSTRGEEFIDQIFRLAQ